MGMVWLYIRKFFGIGDNKRVKNQLGKGSKLNMTLAKRELDTY